MRLSNNARFLTGNKHKFMEAQAVVAEYGIELEMVDAEAVEIQHHDLRDIALYSLKDALSKGHSPPLLVEDSGLFVDALKGFPGPYSSYVYATIGLSGILKLMNGSEFRASSFRSVVAVALGTSSFNTYEGVVQGVLAKIPVGASGFGFDPLFIPEGVAKTFAQMSSEEKNLYSHRAQAFRNFARSYSR